MPGTCCFFGHRDTPSDVYPIVVAAIKKLVVEQDVQTFYVGSHGNFDRITTSAVREVKVQHPEIELLFVTPYLSPDKTRYEGYGYDGIIFPEGLELVPKKYAILRRNRIVVDMSDFIIASVGYSWGGAAKALEYAHSKKQLPVIINIYEERNAT